MNTTIIIRQIKEYTGAYGKAYTLLYLIGAVTILTSCVKDDLYDTPHPDRGAVVVTTDWSGKSTEADIPQAYTLRIGGREQNVSAATNVFDALLAPGGYGLTVYNSPEGISIDGNKATVNPVDLTGAIEPHPGYLFASHQDISVVADDTLHVTAPMRQYVRRLDIELTATEGDYSRVQSATATLSGVASAADMATGDRSAAAQVTNAFRQDGNKFTIFFRLLNAAMAFIFKHLSLSGTTDTLEREEHLTIPYKAIREGVLNSLTHRSYKEAGGSVGIAIYDDRVEIENPGTFPPDWDAEKMRSEHESKPQNPLLANVLYKRKVLESWGRGIGLMMSECRKAGLPEPEYRIWADSVTLIFKCEVTNRPSTDQAPTKYRPSTDQVLALVKILNERELSVKEIMEALELNHRPTFRTNYLHPALNEGYVIPLYPEQPSHPKQKYRLTEKGLELLKQQ